MYIYIYIYMYNHIYTCTDSLAGFETICSARYCSLMISGCVLRKNHEQWRTLTPDVTLNVAENAVQTQPVLLVVFISESANGCGKQRNGEVAMQPVEMELAFVEFGVPLKISLALVKKAANLAMPPSAVVMHVLGVRIILAIGVIVIMLVAMAPKCNL